MDDSTAGKIPHQPAQIPLALDYAPPKLREHGLRDAHSKPLAAWGSADLWGPITENQ